MELGGSSPGKSSIMDGAVSCLAGGSMDAFLLYALVFWDETFVFYCLLSVFSIPGFVPSLLLFAETQSPIKYLLR
jgi:hypothetical protein